MLHKFACGLFVVIGGIGTLMGTNLWFQPQTLLPMFELAGPSTAPLADCTRLAVTGASLTALIASTSSLTVISASTAIVVLLPSAAVRVTDPPVATTASVEAYVVTDAVT